MSLKVCIREASGFKIATIKCPACNRGEFRYIIGPDSKDKKYNLTCQSCFNMTDPDIFEMLKDTYYGKKVFKDFITKKGVGNE